MLANNFRCKEFFSEKLIKVKKFQKAEISRLNISYPDFHFSGTGTIEEYIEEFFSSLGKWGLADKKGKIVSACIYSKIYNLQDEFAKVFKGNKGYGYITSNGGETIPCQYSDAKDFHSGMAAV